MPQDTVLFNDGIRYNVQYGDTDAPEDQPSRSIVIVLRRGDETAEWECWRAAAPTLTPLTVPPTDSKPPLLGLQRVMVA